MSSGAVGEAFLRSVDANPIDTGRFEDRPSLLNRHNAPLVIPCITPRFVPTCTMSMMQSLGAISLKYGLPVQSHLSESLGEMDWVRALHPEHSTYAGVYEAANLLHRSTLMGHCCHCDVEERGVLRRTNTVAVHCPSSNFLLDSGIMDVRRFIADGIRVALGTDVAGGASASMLDAMRNAISASRAVGFDHTHVSKYGVAVKPMEAYPSPFEVNSVPTYAPMTYKEVFHLATLAGADALGMGNVVGNFEVGKQLDCLVVDPSTAGGPIDAMGEEDYLEMFQKFIFLGDDRNIKSVFVNGRQVIG